jgi:superfamily I DNA/RNA helicase
MTLTAPAPTTAPAPAAYAPTSEQQQAIDLFNTGQNVVIIALAGTGKTSTLRFLAQQDPARRGLYLSFNKAIAQDAKAKFHGLNVDCRTAHSLAYSGFGAPRAARLKQRMSPTEHARTVGMSRLDIKGYNMVHKIAAPTAMKVVLDTIRRFCQTADTDILPAHVTVPGRLNFTLNDAALRATSGDADERAAAVQTEQAAEAEFIDEIVRWAKVLWADISDLNGQLPVDHSHYLKLWALSNPKLPYSYILYDEAQDSDPATTGVVLGQEHSQIVAVGDSHQAIYAWRGSINSLDFFGGEHVYLTQSFRFGEAVAEFANVALRQLDAKKMVRGTPGLRSSVHYDKHSYREPNAILCRTNGGAMVEILYWLGRDRKVGIAGEKKAQELRAIAQAALDLQEKHWTTHPDFKEFKRWEDVLESVSDEDNGDAGLSSMVNVIVRTGAENIIAAIDTCVPVDEADVVISTVHVAKGLEWRHVRISADFRPPKLDDAGEVIPLGSEEMMILYVAITRAKRHLDAQNLAWLLDYTAGVES